ncbi:MAG: hypothetical protein WCL70_06540 [Paludibacter sp.]
MKNNFFKVATGVLFVSVLSFMFVSCKTAKVVAAADSGEIEIKIPCSGADFQSNSKALRYSAIGESMDQMTAKKKAMSEARAGLAGAINTLVKGVTDNYVKSSNYNNKEELMKNYEGMNREVINQSLTGSTVICEKTTMTKAGTYKYYVCIELGGNDILQQINNKMTTNEQLKVDYNYEKFKKTFNEEMGKIGQ